VEVINIKLHVYIIHEGNFLICRNKSGLLGDLLQYIRNIKEPLCNVVLSCNESEMDLQEISKS